MSVSHGSVKPPRRLPAHRITLVEALIFAGGMAAAVLVGAIAAAPLPL
jgi:hypothetical protein